MNQSLKAKLKKFFFLSKIRIQDLLINVQKNLKSKGIIVINGVLKDKIKFFYRSYLKSKKINLPFVTCKLAISKDFYTINKKKKWITNEFSRGRVHLMRASHDCIITSSKTIIKDNPRLTCRIDGLKTEAQQELYLITNLR